MSEEVDDFLEHFGVPGMKWGKRKARDHGDPIQKSGKLSPEQQAKLKKAAVIVGTAAAVTLLVAGTVYASKHMNKPAPTNVIPSLKTKAFVEAKMPELVGVLHASRGKERGFSFMQKGGLPDPLREYDKAPFNERTERSFIARYGANQEKVAARFLDPEGRKDAAGRPIPHEVILPKELAKDVHSLDDAISKVWPLIKDTYAQEYTRGRYAADDKPTTKTTPVTAPKKPSPYPMTPHLATPILDEIMAKYKL